MPENTVSVARPGAFGNPFGIAAAVEAGVISREWAAEFVVNCFEDWLAGGEADWTGPQSEACRDKLLARLPELRGKNLACWCRLDHTCHGDVLLRLANSDEAPSPVSPNGEVRS